MGIPVMPEIGIWGTIIGPVMPGTMVIGFIMPAIGAIIGACMKATQGKADPGTISALVNQVLEKSS